MADVGASQNSNPTEATSWVSTGSIGNTDPMEGSGAGGPILSTVGDDRRKGSRPTVGAAPSTGALHGRKGSRRIDPMEASRRKGLEINGRLAVKGRLTVDGVA